MTNKIRTNRIRREEYATSRYVINVEAGTTLADLVRPSFYADVANQIRKNDYIRVLFDDGSKVVDLLVIEIDSINKTPVWAKVIITNLVNIAEALKKTSSLVEEEKTSTAEQPATANGTSTIEISHPDYEIKFRGAKKFSIIRKSDKAILQEDLLSKEAASDALKILIAKLN